MGRVYLDDKVNHSEGTRQINLVTSEEKVFIKYIT